MNPTLEAYGWSAARAEEFRPHAAEGHIPARVLTQARETTRAISERGELDVVLQRAFRREVADRTEFPAVGDWLSVEPRDEPDRAALRTVLPRSSAFVRQHPGGSHTASGQVVAANVDVVLLVASANADFNDRRLERYVALALQSGAQPVVVLNKVDRCPDPAEYLDRIAAVAPALPAHPVSAVSGIGLEDLRRYVGPGRTMALLGSSGVGKSTLINALLGWDRQNTAEIREADSRGRHTTVSRELILLPGGGVLVDTPGIRSVGLWDAQEGVDETFADIRDLATRCRFNDCRHNGEPGCAIAAALEAGELDPRRLEAQRKLDQELESVERRGTPEQRAANRRFGKMIKKTTRDVMTGKADPRALDR